MMLNYWFILNLLFMVGYLLLTTFVSLYERKLLGYIQFRKGPNKNLLAGLVQPVVDGVKLIFKFMMMIQHTNYSIMIFVASLKVMMIFFIWLLINFKVYMSLNFILFILLMISILGYPIFLMGYSSNSLYTLLGSFRNMFQIISYELIIFTILLVLVLYNYNFFIQEWYKNNMFMNSVYMFIFSVCLITLILLSESNRAPLDFIEGESELVSGFNTELSSLIFAMFTFAEYGMLFLMTYLFMLFFFYPNICLFLLFFMMHTLILSCRGFYPRLRLDLMLNTYWHNLLPASFLLFLVILVM